MSNKRVCDMSKVSATFTCFETRNMSPVSSVDEALGFGGGCFGGSCLRVVGQGLSSIHPGVLSPRICLCRSHLLRKKTPII